MPFSRVLKALPAGLAFILLGSATASADLVIVQRTDGPGQSGQATIKLHGSKMRADISSKISVIRDGQTGDSVTLMHPEKSYLRVTGAAAAALRQQVMAEVPPIDASPSPAPATPKLLPTGRKEKINGFEAEEYTTQAGALSVRYWIARSFPNWADVLTQMLRIQQSGMDRMVQGHVPGPADFPGMPIRTEVEMGGQKVTTTILSVKDQPLDAAEFETPPGYKELTSPAFGARPSPIP